jgi:hypothetical protein
VVEVGEVRWFDRAWIVLLAAHFILKKGVRKRRVRRTEEATDKSIFDANGDYRPELRKRRPSPESVGPPPSKTPKLRSQEKSERPKRETPPVRTGNRSKRPMTQILPEWWTMDLPQGDAATEAHPASTPAPAQSELREGTSSPPAHARTTPSHTVLPARTVTVIDPRWFDEDWKPKK